MGTHIFRLLTCRHDGKGLALSKSNYGALIALLVAALAAAWIGGYGGSEGEAGFVGRFGGILLIAFTCMAAGFVWTLLPAILVISSIIDLVTGVGGVLLATMGAEVLLNGWITICMFWQIACVMSLFFRHVKTGKSDVSSR